MSFDKHLETQLERINAIANTITGISAADYPPAEIDTRLPVLLPLVGAFTFDEYSQSEKVVVTVWDLYLYLAPANQGLDKVNQVDLYAYLDQFANAYMQRKWMQLTGSGALAYVRNTSFELVSGLSSPITYPPRGGTARYWGCQYRLTITSETKFTQVQE